MARIRRIVEGTQRVAAHKPENAVTCQWQVIGDENGDPLVHLSTFGSEGRQSNPKSSQSLQLSRADAIELVRIFNRELKLGWVEDGAPEADTAAPVIEKFAPATEELAEELLMPVEWLQRSIELLRDRPQLIFYGPPGTGKTYLARKLAEHLCGDRVTVVQFHPTYSYEDFFEGLRPASTEGGQITYELHHGPLRQVAEQAQREPDRLHALVIDEINRGNLSKIFGELYYLLEYRDETIQLMYSGERMPFRLPENILVIGTMNRADRSVASLDTAMRRRFSFVHLHPSREPTRDLLRNWLDKNGHSRVIAELLDVLNSSIDDDDFKLGPSYLMGPAAQSRHKMEITWQTRIIPLLEDYHLNEPDVDVDARYALSEIESRMSTELGDWGDSE
ncbi:McrB family protein [Nocardia sp. NPDC057227]|uniref:McrB family protein n=1 Tax=Nocardia sp. NPDC057227 TaxID=3346056 RepID=UPI0036400C53